ncbi:MAG: hypothetical protein O7A03_08075 [Alphaproteobacteria bacterium]|nr:hypothetical protein [Alphaproteobacteria bacterium]
MTDRKSKGEEGSRIPGAGNLRRAGAGEILPFGSRYPRLPPKTHLFIEGENSKKFLVAVTGLTYRQ